MYESAIQDMMAYCYQLLLKKHREYANEDVLHVRQNYKASQQSRLCLG